MLTRCQLLVCPALAWRATITHMSVHAHLKMSWICHCSCVRMLVSVWTNVCWMEDSRWYRCLGTCCWSIHSFWVFVVVFFKAVRLQVFTTKSCDTRRDLEGWDIFVVTHSSVTGRIHVFVGLVWMKYDPRFPFYVEFFKMSQNAQVFIQNDLDQRGSK